MDDNVVMGLVIVDGFLALIRLWALLRAATRPGWAFQAVGKSKAFWVVLLAVMFFLPFVGFAVAIGYLFSTDTKVGRQARLGPGIRGPGGF